MAYGYKSIETRSWQPPKGLIGSRIAIHAAKRPIPRKAERNSLHSDIHDAMHEIYGAADWYKKMPYGAVVATAKLTLGAETWWRHKRYAPPPRSRLRQESVDPYGGLRECRSRSGTSTGKATSPTHGLAVPMVPGRRAEAEGAGSRQGLPEDLELDAAGGAGSHCYGMKPHASQGRYAQVVIDPPWPLRLVQHADVAQGGIRTGIGHMADETIDASYEI